MAAAFRDVLEWSAIGYREGAATLQVVEGRLTRARAIGLAWRVGQAAPARLQMAWRVRRARRLRIMHHDNGFFANFLSVLEVLPRVRPEALVRVDWTLTGREEHFRYGRPGDDVWCTLFEPLCDPAAFEAANGEIVPIGRRLSPLFVSRGREALHRWPRFGDLRRVYGAALQRWIRVRDERVLAEVESVAAGPLRGGRWLGVHKRAAVPAVARNQADLRNRSMDSWLRATRHLLESTVDPPAGIFLATDEDEAVEAFTAAFPGRLVVRSGLGRVPAQGPRIEVHRRPWSEVSLDDARDVLIDGLLLARCDRLLHASSNVTTAVAFMNPRLTLLHVVDVLASI